MAHKQDPSPQPVAKPGDPIDLATSVAGEEDPGASIDLAEVPAGSKPGARPVAPPSTPVGQRKA